jgi:hypothetical protein
MQGYNLYCPALCTCRGKKSGAQPALEELVRISLIQVFAAGQNHLYINTLHCDMSLKLCRQIGLSVILVEKLKSLNSYNSSSSARW